MKKRTKIVAKRVAVGAKRLTLPVSIVLPIPLQNSNEGRAGTWHKSANSRKSIEGTLRLFRHVYDPSDMPPVKLTITRLWGRGQKPLDEDSLGRGNAKQLIDSMVACGWLVDDSRPHVMQCDYRQRKSDDGIAATLVEMTRWMVAPQGVTQAEHDRVIRLYVEATGEIARLDRALTLLESQPTPTVPTRTIRRLEPLPYPLD